jgi:hypothetical protein
MFGGLKKLGKKALKVGASISGLGMLGGLMGAKAGDGGSETAVPSYKQVLPELQKHTAADQSTYNKLNAARARFGGSAINRPAEYRGPTMQERMAADQAQTTKLGLGLGALGGGFGAMARAKRGSVGSMGGLMNRLRTKNGAKLGTRGMM